MKNRDICYRLMNLGAGRQKKSTEIAQHDYPAMRGITGMYHMREITLTK